MLIRDVPDDVIAALPGMGPTGRLPTETGPARPGGRLGFGERGVGPGRSG